MGVKWEAEGRIRRSGFGDIRYFDESIMDMCSRPCREIHVNIYAICALLGDERAA